MRIFYEIFEEYDPGENAPGKEGRTRRKGEKNYHLNESKEDMIMYLKTVNLAGFGVEDHLGSLESAEAGSIVLTAIRHGTLTHIFHLWLLSPP